MRFHYCFLTQLTFQAIKESRNGWLIIYVYGEEITLYMTGLISCTKTVLVDSPCHPRLLLALTRKRHPGSTTMARMKPTTQTHMRETHASGKYILHDARG